MYKLLTRDLMYSFQNNYKRMIVFVLISFSLFFVYLHKSHSAYQTFENLVFVHHGGQDFIRNNLLQIFFVLGPCFIIYKTALYDILYYNKFIITRYDNRGKVILTKLISCYIHIFILFLLVFLLLYIISHIYDRGYNNVATIPKILLAYTLASISVLNMILFFSLFKKEFIGICVAILFVLLCLRGDIMFIPTAILYNIDLEYNVNEAFYTCIDVFYCILNYMIIVFIYRKIDLL